MSHYAAGAQFERKVRDRLYADGARLVVRSAGSKGPVDLVALFPPLWLPRLVQVKRNGRMTKAAKKELLELAKSVDGLAVVATPEKIGRRVVVKLEVLSTNAIEALESGAGEC